MFIIVRYVEIKSLTASLLKKKELGRELQEVLVFAIPTKMSVMHLKGQCRYFDQGVQR